MQVSHRSLIPTWTRGKQKQKQVNKKIGVLHIFLLVLVLFSYLVIYFVNQMPGKDLNVNPLSLLKELVKST